MLKRNKVHKYILLIHLDVMDNFFDGQRNMECNIREIKNRKCNRITMLRASSCPSCVWMQASPQSTAQLRDLALSLYTAHRTSISMVYTAIQ